MKHKLGPMAIVAAAAVPILIWILMLPLSQRFGSLANGLQSLGQLAALVGVVLFSLSFVLNSRIAALEEYFGGLDKMLAWHHLAGAASFVLLLFHPIFLAARFLGFSLKMALAFLLPGSELANNFGIIALFIMMALLAMTFFVKLAYHRWKFFHQFLGIAFIIASLHVLLISSDVSRSMSLRLYILSWAAVGILFYFKRTVLGSLLTRKYSYKVADVNKLNEEIIEIVLSPVGEHLHFTPGQFAFLRFPAVTKENHPFTISSSPSEPNLRFTIKALGDHTSKLRELAIGSPVEVEGPHGRFLVSNLGEQIWIAGGIGITPFLSRARSRMLPARVDFYYTVTRAEEAVFAKELAALESKTFKFNLVITAQMGRLTADKISEQCGSLSAKQVYICGPSSMLSDLAGQLKKAGARHIHSEIFGFL